MQNHCLYFVVLVALRDWGRTKKKSYSVEKNINKLNCKVKGESHLPFLRLWSMKPTAATTPVITMAAITPPKIAPELREPERNRKSHLAPTSLLRIESSITCDTVDGPETSKCGNITMLLPDTRSQVWSWHTAKNIRSNHCLARFSFYWTFWSQDCHQPLCNEAQATTISAHPSHRVLKVKLVPSSPMSPRKAPGFTVGSVSRKWSLRGGCCHDLSVQCFSILGLFLLQVPHLHLSKQNKTKQRNFLNKYIYILLFTFYL